MFDTPKEKLWKILLNRIEENHDIWQENIWIKIEYWFKFEWYDIYLEYDSYWKLANWSYCRKDWINIFDSVKDIWFYSQLASIINKKNEIRKKIWDKKRKAEEEILAQEMLSKYEGYIQELNWIQKKEWTEEFDEVMEDTKRLQEIAKEAKKIHDKYKKPFYNLFTNN